MPKKESKKEKGKLTSSEKDKLDGLQKKKKDLRKMLSRLEEKKGATRPNVYAKVKKDYEERLSEVESELKGKEEAIRQELERIATEKEELTTKIEVLQEELEEIALRHDTGEYNDKLFGKMESDKRMELDPLEEALQELEDEEAPFRELVEAGEFGEEEETVEVEAPSREEEAVAVEEAMEDLLDFEEKPAKAKKSAKAEEVTEEILEVEETEEIEEAATPEAVTEQLLAEEAALKESERELEELIKELEDSGVEIDDSDKPAQAVEEKAEKGVSVKVEKAKDILSDEEIFKEEEKELEELLGGDKESGEEAGPADEGLVCKKCGTLNKPDSWYCEKCGAELIEAEG